ncbi:MAG: PHP domain-containing protein, partial [Mycobacteriaceae bacterium]
MGWENPPVPWSQLEHVLSGRAPAPPQPGRARPVGDGGDGPAFSRKRAPYEVGAPPPPAAVPVTVPFAELHAHSSFSFLDGASQPEQLVEEAARLGLQALALTDHDGFHGIVRFAEAAREHGLPTVFGSELSLGLPGPQNGVADPTGTHLLVLARGQEGYRRLSRAIADALLAGGEKGRPVYDLDALTAAAGGHWQVLTGCRKGSVRRALDTGGPEAASRALGELVERFGADRVTVELTHHGLPDDDERNDVLATLARLHHLQVIASTAAHYATPQGHRLAAAMSAVRARRSLDEAVGWLPPAGGAHLRSGAELAARFTRHPDAVPTAAALGRELAFDLRLVAPNLPPFDVGPGHTEATWLRHLTMLGAAHRYGSPVEHPAAYTQIERELAVITALNFPGYFLVVHDIVEFCRRQDILCQGRGSAANSAVCFALGITPVDAVANGLLFERFLSPERDGPPDIDVDIESGRREEAIQHVYERYGRTRAAQVANVITYRGRSAVRDMAKALGFSAGQQDAWSKQIDRWGPLRTADQATLDAADHDIPMPVLELAREIEDFPRHLGIHSGGMVICDRPVADVVPVEWGRMPGRTVLQWDKDDCAAVGLVKFDLLGLGILSALQHCFDLVGSALGETWSLDSIPKEEPGVYDQLCRADVIGIFQVESRAQMSMLPRLQPREFYHLAVEIAVVRPGPVQGGAVHPYVRRKR